MNPWALLIMMHLQRTLQVWISLGPGLQRIRRTLSWLRVALLVVFMYGVVHCACYIIPYKVFCMWTSTTSITDLCLLSLRPLFHLRLQLPRLRIPPVGLLKLHPVRHLKNGHIYLFHYLLRYILNFNIRFQ